MTERSKAAIPSAEDGGDELIAGRYRAARKLGGGGMAVVHEVIDQGTGQRVALKRPHSDGNAEHRKRTEELFAREFHTLVQLAHPRIVEVYDYGVDQQGPFYTMELLDGGDLQGLVPVDYRRACAIGCDVCSALSLLHSRRIVHRDVSPRNIRCTSDGLAKLIDFGAMTHMGPSKELVGTPVYCAPEILNMQALDARTDLYALGASLYFALTGHHPYPVRDFAGLPNAWRFAIARPSELVPGIPDALDALILDLLQLQPAERPSNAAEVMARLSAIAGTALDEQLLVAQAYLATPACVGREAELSRVEAKMLRALRKRGAALLIEGAAGSGRSRFLEASLLNSKLLGMTVVRADADDGETDYGVARRWMTQLLQIVPGLMREVAEPVLPVIAEIIPELAAGRDLTSAAAPDLVSLRPQLQAALRQILLGVAGRTPLLLAIDDLHAIDEPSLALIGVVARSIRESPLVILATAVSDAAPAAVSAFKLFADAAHKVVLPDLTQDQTQTLLASVFGASHSLEALTLRMHALSGGSPRDLMRIAQHLVDSGGARYHGGGWSLLADVSAAELPSSVAQMLSRRLQLLVREACDLARALALCPQKSFSLEECRLLSDQDQPGAVLADVEQLTKADVLRVTGERVVLSDRAWVPLLCEGLEPTRERALHVRLAQVFEVRPDEAFRHAQHLLRAGQVERALDKFVAHAIASRALTDRNSEAFHQLLLSLPGDWLDTYTQVLQLLHESRRPQRDEFAVLARLSGLGALVGVAFAQLSTHLALLKQASGLSDWEQSDPTLEPGARLQHALGQAQARYTASPESERFADPGTAIRELATAVRMTVSAAALSMDLNAAQSVPSLQPLIALAPALGVAEQVTRGVQARLSGRIDRAREIYTALLERLAAPGGAGLDPTHVEYTRLMVRNGVAVLDAASGIAGCLDAADQIEKHPVLQSNAWLIRMVYQLWQGNSHEAERCRRRFELARVQNSAAQTHETVHLTWQLIAHVAAEDLTRIKRSLDEVAALAVRVPAFRTVLSYGEAEYQRIRGDTNGALSSLTTLLQTCEPGAHQIWPQLAAAHVRASDEAGRSAEAAELGRAYLAGAMRAELGTSALDWISLALCVAEANLADARATQTADAVLEHCRALGVTGLKLGLAYEARTRVAMLQGDATNYDCYRALCELAFASAANPALAAKLQKLKRAAQRRQLVSQAPMLESAQRSVTAHTVKSRLAASTDVTERARAMLALLAHQCGADQGFLYYVRDNGPAWVASVGSREPDAALHDMAREYIMAEVQPTADTTGASQLTVQTDWTAFGATAYRPVLLSHYADAGYSITGLAVFVVDAASAFAYPGELAAQISRTMQDAGDVTGVLVEVD